MLRTILIVLVIIILAVVVWRMLCVGRISPPGSSVGASRTGLSPAPAAIECGHASASTPHTRGVHLGGKADRASGG